jgi:hypothetical protein
MTYSANSITEDAFAASTRGQTLFVQVMRAEVLTAVVFSLLLQ